MATLRLIVQEPVIELPIESRDASGSKQKFIAGFKRYPANEAKEKISEYENIVNDSNFEMLNSSELDEFIKKQVLYLKKVRLPAIDENTGEKTFINISDTREAQKIESLWETPEECLEVLLDTFFKWSSWRVSFISQVQAALLDADYSESLRKNF